jgi:SPASM domain peptide maturase of grasp-with-spasm system
VLSVLQADLPVLPAGLTSAAAVLDAPARPEDADAGADQRIFRLFACCIPVRGARRSTLCDLQRQSYRLIPNALYEILTVHRGRTVEEVKEALGHEHAETIDEYFAFLVEHDFGFWCDDPDAYPELDLTWEAPERVTNAIIDTGRDSRHDYARILAQLDELGCRALQLRWFHPVPLSELDAVLALTCRNRLRSLDVVVPHTDELSDEVLEALCSRHQRVFSVFVHSAPEKRVRRVRGGMAVISHRPEVVDSAAHCGQVSPAYFNVTLGAFTEAQAHNSCLNRKISVDERGEIRNCPAMPRSFGNAASTSLHAALAADGFRDLWKVSKDQVDVCRDCEFRFVCTDCRAFTQNAADPLSKPAKCAYDPYTAQWR